MEYLRIEKIHEGRFLCRYNVIFKNALGKEKAYEIVSRNNHLTSLDDIRSAPADGVTMIMHNEDKTKILLIREYRMALGEWIYSFPAGLIDPGESPEIAAARELKEETGLTLVHIDAVLQASFNAIGFTNEKIIPVIGTASGEFKASTSANEEIRSAWYSRSEVVELLKSEKFASRPQIYCYNWANLL